MNAPRLLSFFATALLAMPAWTLHAQYPGWRKNGLHMDIPWMSTFTNMPV